MLAKFFPGGKFVSVLSKCLKPLYITLAMSVEIHSAQVTILISKQLGTANNNHYL